MDMVGVRVEGAARLRSTMRKAGADMKDLARINKKAATIVAAAAKASAPTGDPKNGHIKTTIRAGATQKAGIVRVGDRKRPYGGVVHWGWPGRNITALPWVATAAKSTESQWVDQYWDDLMKTINKIQGD